MCSSYGAFVHRIMGIVIKFLRFKAMVVWVLGLVYFLILSKLTSIIIFLIAIKNNNERRKIPTPQLRPLKIPSAQTMPRFQKRLL